MSRYLSIVPVRISRCCAGVALALTLSFHSATAAQTAPKAHVPLDRQILRDYVRQPDTNFNFTLVSSLPGEAADTYVLELTSQAWLDASMVDRPVWKHWLTVVVPHRLNRKQALLLIGGGRNGEPAPTKAPGQLVNLASDTRSVVAELRQVPNQPLRLAGDSEDRIEDSLIAASWDRFLRTGDSRLPLRLPMTKSVVRAMDAITSFVQTNASRPAQLEGFAVTGASKRGWTTWSTAAVDDRVKAIMPMVFDALNLEASMRHHFGAYGFWAPAIGDYSRARVMDWLGTPEFEALMRIEDPFAYRERLTMPKFMIHASGDQFFLPDSSQFYFSALPGTNYMRYVANADHSLKETDALNSLASFYTAFLNQEPLPRFDWVFEKDGSIRTKAADAPANAVVWQAHNPGARDFRADVFGKNWQSSPVVGDKAGVFVARVASPTNGYTAFFLEFTFRSQSGQPLKFTTAVRVLPETLPYEFKPQKPPR